MGKLTRSEVTLRIFGELLEPDEITRIVRCSPTRSCRAGELMKSPSGKPLRKAKEGAWMLKAETRSPANLDDQIMNLFTQLNPETEIWAKINQNYRAELFCGLMLETFNEGIGLKGQTIREIGSRGLLIDFDIYYLNED